MFQHRLDQKPSRAVVLHWFLLAFNGGCINAGGFLATGRFVSHVTGFATLFGVDLVNRGSDAAIGILSVPTFFLLGAFLAGLLIDRPIYLHRKPHFDYVMGLSAFCLYLASFGAGVFGQFGEVIKLSQIYILLALLCLACGLQNGAITSSSGSSVRTTHMSGLTTDFGLGLARLLTLHDGEADYPKEILANKLRAGSILSFVLGSAVGAWIFIQVGYRGFVLSAVIATYAAWHGRRAKIVPHHLTSV
ncbi:MAG: YoaK family protein [Oligoflexia bacterium]|nr:YoaK family protein [Oligoflexia bacterium]